MDSRLCAPALYRDNLIASLAFDTLLFEIDFRLTSQELLKYFVNSLAFFLELWQSIFCVGERPMTNKTQNSMRRPEPTGRRASFLYSK
jgi:hypothetical protein